MATPAIIAITPGAGQLLDAVTLMVGSNTVVRETMVIADPTSPTQLAGVTPGGALSVSDAAVEACITANVLAISLPSATITTLTPPTAAAIAAAIVANPPAVTGTVTVNQGTSPWVISGAVTCSQTTSPWVISGAVTTSGTATVSGTIAFSNTTIAVTNAGTFVVQATLAPETTKVIGTVNISAAQTIAVTNTGTFVVQATLAAETTKVIGTVNIAAAQTIAVTGADSDNATNSAAKVPVIAARANATVPAWTEAHEAPLSVDLQGSLRTKPGAPTTAGWSSLPINFSASGAHVIVPLSGSTTVRIMRIFFVNSDASTATNITIQDTNPTSLSGAFRLISSGVFTGNGNGEPLYVSAAGQGIQLNSSAAVQISGSVWYTQS